MNSLPADNRKRNKKSPAGEFQTGLGFWIGFLLVEVRRKHPDMKFEKDDVLHLAISDESEAGSVEISPNITAELNDKGELIGIEILSASTFIRDAVIDSVQARMLDLVKAKSG